MKTRRLTSLPLVLLVLAFCAASASAATRYVSPLGSSAADCSALTPCDIVTGINSAPVQSEVIIGPGAYGSEASPITNPLFGGTDINVHGQVGAARPVIYSSAYWGIWPQNGSSPGPTLSDIELRKVGGAFGIVASDGAVVERVKSVATAGSACSPGGTFRDALCISTGPDAAMATAIGAGGSTGPDINVRNVTAIATGGGSAYDLAFTNYGVTVNVFNSIFQSSETDITLYAANTPTVNLNVSNSNYREYVGSPSGGATIHFNPTANQSADPLFVNAADGDFRQAAGSPTIDAGADSADNGATDLDGASRIQGVKTDIGAFEFAPATASQPIAPRLSGFKFKPSKFKPAKRGATWQVAKNFKKPKRGKTAVGSVMSFSADNPGQFVLVIERVTKGRKSGKRCVKQTSKNKTKKSCKITKQLKGSYVVPVAAGATSVYFNGRWNNSPLPTGTYHVTPTLCAGGSPPVPTPGPSSGGGTSTGGTTGGSTLPASNGDQPGTAGGGVSTICKSSKGPAPVSTVVVK
ncbi:MAG: choice-of-anchor Q domain-containing protein [Solirubrobacterales bacterium]